MCATRGMNVSPNDSPFDISSRKLTMDVKNSTRAQVERQRKYSLPCVLKPDIVERRFVRPKPPEYSSKSTTNRYSSKPFVSTKPNAKNSSWSRGATVSDKHGNIFRNFYNVGYQRQRRLINYRKIWWQSRQNRNEPGFVIAVFHLIMKLRERVVICFGITFVLFTLILVIDFQYEIGYGGRRLFLPMRHGRVQVVDNAEGENSVYRTFQNRFGPAQYGYGDEASAVEGSQTVNTTIVHDSYSDLLPYTASYEDLEPNDPGRNVIIVVYEYRESQPSLSEYINFDLGINKSLEVEFHKRISKREMYKENDPLVAAILKELQTKRIVHVREKEGGTQLKLIIHYDTGDFALFKPMRFPREQQTLPNHFYFTDYERHNAEIAAFHLDRILGFRRAMPVTGRVLNLTSEFYKIADGELLKTFFVSPANNLCFHGHCSYYCDTSHAICGSPDKVEGSFAAFLPEKQVADRTLRKHPWRRSYHKRRKATWETEPNYCDAVKQTAPYSHGILLLDLIDTSIFDFLMGNMDRHHFETFTAFGNDTFPLHLDHGRGFGKPFHDELSILAPLTQCCIIKQSTLVMLLRLHNGEKKLSHLLRESLHTDPIDPVLWEPHFEALDRRINIILEAIRTCVKYSKESSGASKFEEHSADVSPASPVA